MGEKADSVSSDEIKRDIDLERSRLGMNLQQLDDKLKATLDWRVQFRKQPMRILSLAFAGGLMLSILISGRHA